MEEDTPPHAAECRVRVTSSEMRLARCEGEWTANYVAFLAACGFHNAIPARRVQGRPLSLYLLYQAVAKMGGLSRVEKGGYMRDVTEDLGYSSLARQPLKAIYHALLSPFEEFEARDDNNSLPRAIPESGRSAVVENAAEPERRTPSDISRRVAIRLARGQVEWTAAYTAYLDKSGSQKPPVETVILEKPLNIFR